MGALGRATWLWLQGTHRVLSALDQMSNVQSSASRGGEFTDGVVTSGWNCLDLASQLEKGSAMTTLATFSCSLEPPFASGCD
jgi:hypothetical protein